MKRKKTLKKWVSTKLLPHRTVLSFFNYILPFICAHNLYLVPVFEQYFNKFLDFLNQYEDKLNEFELKKFLPTYYLQEEAVHPFFAVRKKNTRLINKPKKFIRTMKHRWEF